MLHVSRREAQWGGASFVLGLLLSLALLMPAQGGHAQAESAAQPPAIVVRVTSMAEHPLDAQVLLRHNSRTVDNATLAPWPGQRAEAGFHQDGGVYAVLVQWSFRTEDGWRRQSQEFVISTGNCAGTEYVEFVIDGEPEPNRGQDRVDVADAWSHCGP